MAAAPCRQSWKASQKILITHLQMAAAPQLVCYPRLSFCWMVLKLVLIRSVSRWLKPLWKIENRL